MTEPTTRPRPDPVWIGGLSGAGKSTVARRLVRRWGLRLYACDTRTWEHRDRSIASGSAAAVRWEGLTPAERVALPAAEHRDLELIHERRAMILEDLVALPPSPLVLAEGTLLPPEAADPTRSVWLVPTVELQARHRADPDRRADPREVVVAAVRAHGIPVVGVDGTQPVSDIVDEVESWLGTALAAGPLATTVDERRSLLRTANLDVVRQIRSGCARPWATNDPEAQVRTFTCECGDTACTDDVDTTVAAAAARPVVAPGHGPG